MDTKNLSFTYSEVTKSAEGKIQFLLGLASTAPSADVANDYRAQAKGVFSGWIALTAQRGTAEDYRRLDDLTSKQ